LKKREDRWSWRIKFTNIYMADDRDGLEEECVLEEENLIVL